MMSAFMFVVGLIITAIGGLMIVGAFMPSFGGSSRKDDGIMLVSGIMLFLLGLAMTFYAGTWA